MVRVRVGRTRRKRENKNGKWSRIKEKKLDTINIYFFKKVEDERMRQRKITHIHNPVFLSYIVLIRNFFKKKSPKKSNKQNKGIKGRVCAHRG